MSLMAQSSGLVGRPGNDFDRPSCSSIEIGLLRTVWQHAVYIQEHSTNWATASTGLPLHRLARCPTSPPAPGASPPRPLKLSRHPLFFPLGLGIIRDKYLQLCFFSSPRHSQSSTHELIPPSLSRCHGRQDCRVYSLPGPEARNVRHSCCHAPERRDCIC